MQPLRIFANPWVGRAMGLLCLGIWYEDGFQTAIWWIFGLGTLCQVAKWQYGIEPLFIPWRRSSKTGRARKRSSTFIKIGSFRKASSGTVQAAYMRLHPHWRRWLEGQASEGNEEASGNPQQS